MLYPKYFKEKKDGIKRKTFLRNLEGWMFESPRPGAAFKTVTVRVITANELSK